MPEETAADLPEVNDKPEESEVPEESDDSPVSPAAETKEEAFAEEIKEETPVIGREADSRVMVKCAFSSASAPL